MSQNEYSSIPRWYVIHTNPGYEEKVEKDLKKTVENRELHDYFFDIKLLKQVKVNKLSKGKTKEEIVFPGYILVNMIVTDKTWYIVRNTRGVTGFVGAGTQPIPLSEEELKTLGLATKHTDEPIDLNIGDRVEILSGLMRGYCGKVKEINLKKRKIKISIEADNRENDVESDYENLKKI